MSIKHVSIFLLFLGSLLQAKSYSQAQKSLEEKHIEVSLRMIGHRVLMNAGDSSSLVLPIEKENDQYRVSFASEFEIVPEELTATVDDVMKDALMANGYFVEVEQCDSGKIVYSYEFVDLEGLNEAPCMSRILPSSCYSLLFTLKGNGDDSAETDPVSSDLAVIPNNEESQLTYSFLAFLAFLVASLLFLFWKNRKGVEIDPNMISLGEYQFDKRNTELLLDDQRTELTSKESDLLALLYDGANTTIERDVILQRVWGDEGDYVGRTLDVFISKLRKKLGADPKVKIVNIRGVGYKLVMDDQ